MVSNRTTLDDTPPLDFSILNASMKDVENAILHNSLSSVAQMSNDTLASQPTSENISSLSPTWEENFEQGLKLVVEGYCILMLALCGMILHIAGFCYTITKANRSISVSYTHLTLPTNREV